MKNQDRDPKLWEVLNIVLSSDHPRDQREPFVPMTPAWNEPNEHVFPKPERKNEEKGNKK